MSITLQTIYKLLTILDLKRIVIDIQRNFFKIFLLNDTFKNSL